jgi:hypothetical protein
VLRRKGADLPRLSVSADTYTLHWHFRTTEGGFGSSTTVPIRKGYARVIAFSVFERVNHRAEPMTRTDQDDWLAKHNPHRLSACLAELLLFGSDRLCVLFFGLPPNCLKLVPIASCPLFAAACNLRRRLSDCSRPSIATFQVFLSAFFTPRLCLSGQVYATFSDFKLYHYQSPA